MRNSVFAVLTVLVLVLVMAPLSGIAGNYGARPCPPERCIPPETIGKISIPFDVPIWPTLLKTEFHVLPWISFGKASVCIPGTRKALEFTAPCLSLKPIPVWIPWLRPLDVECKDGSVCAGP